MRRILVATFIFLGIVVGSVGAQRNYHHFTSQHVDQGQNLLVNLPSGWSKIYRYDISFWHNGNSGSELDVVTFYLANGDSTTVEMLIWLATPRYIEFNGPAVTGFRVDTPSGSFVTVHMWK